MQLPDRIDRYLRLKGRLVRPSFLGHNSLHGLLELNASGIHSFIAKSLSSPLVQFLGSTSEFDGVLGCDYFSAYRKYRKDFHPLLQFCLAHLIRDVKFLVEHPNKKNQTYRKRLLADLRQLFGAIHRRAEYASPDTFRRALERIREQLVWAAARRSPRTREAANLAKDSATMPTAISASSPSQTSNPPTTSAASGTGTVSLSQGFRGGVEKSIC